MTREWIAEQRAKLKVEQDNAIGMANQAAGAMKMLDAVEAMLAAQVPAETTRDASDLHSQE